jgi:hypothetical protein
VGTPTTGGDFVVRAQVADSGGLGTVAEFELPLHVNPPLTLRPLVGVAASESIDVAIGTGGTGPQWTPGDPLPGGMQLTGGAELRLSGDTGEPRAFDARGSAVQSVGAPLGETTSRIVVASPLADAAGRAVDASQDFGFWFSALAGSRANLEVRFQGLGPTPRLRELLDDTGTPIVIDGTVRETGRRTRIVGAKLPKTGRYFLLFGGNTFTGDVASRRARISPPTGGRGVFFVESEGDTTELRFEAVAGARLRVVFESAPVPRPARPDFIELRSPTMEVLPLPAGRITHRGRRKIVSGVVLPETGEYVLRLGAAAGSTGSLLYRYRIDTPPGAAFIR